MENIPTQLFIPIGVITAALIAGFFSFLNLVISKEQKVSEFRQAWIDKIREDLCKYISSIRYLASANQVWDNEGRPEPLKHFEAMRSSVDTAAQAYNSILLRINPADSSKKMKPLNEAFLKKLNTVRQHFENYKYDEARTTAGELSVLMQPILKNEWERVKTGEPIYRLTRGVAILIFIAALVGAAYFGYRLYIHMPTSAVAPLANSSLPGTPRP